MRIAGILPESIVDGPGVRFVVFAQGCPHHCKGCHNPETWDLNAGKEMSVKDIRKMLRKKIKYIRGLTLSGGEPFLQADEMSQLALEAKRFGLDVVTYTGFTYERLLQIDLPGKEELLAYSDYLVDGPFILELKDISLAFRGSANQRFIDLKSTRQNGKLVVNA